MASENHNSFWCCWLKHAVYITKSFYILSHSHQHKYWGCFICAFSFTLHIKKWQCKRKHMANGFDGWYLPIEVLWQALALQKTSSLAHSHLTSIRVGVEVDGCVIDGGLWDIRIGGGGRHFGWRGVGCGGRGIRGGESGATRAGSGSGVGWSWVWGSGARLQRKWRLWWLRRGSRRESRWCRGNVGYFGGLRGRRSRDRTAAPPKRPGCLVVSRSGLTRWLGVCSAWGRVSDWDRLNDFLRFVLDKGENTQHARTTNPKSTHACQPAYPKALHNNQIIK